MEKLKNRLKGHPLLAVFTTVFIDLLGVGILIPVFPLLVLPNSPDNILPDGWTIEQGFIMLGWLSAAYPLSQFVAAPILGQFADRYGRKKVLAISIFGTSIGYLLFGLGIALQNIPLLFASRILDGLTGGNISVAQASIADISTAKNRAKNFGMIGMAFGLGFILGPYIGGKLADSGVVSWFNAQTPFYFTALLSLINVFLILLFLPETLKIAKKVRIDVTKPFQNIKIAFSRPGLRNVMPTSFLFTAGFTFFTTFMAIVLAQKFGFSSGNTGDYFAYVGLWIAAVQGGLTGYLSKRFKDYQILRISIFISAISLLGYFLIPTGEYKWLFLVPPFMAIGNGLTMAFNSALISRISPPELQGESLGINSSVMALAQAIPAIMAGYIATVNNNLPIVVGSITITLAGIAFWLLFKPSKFKDCK
jgi:DHA1 family tetracycline resistance protein-like MFS transporter